MRVKLSTSPPLPPLRAWFPLPPSVQGDASAPTISSLKSCLCGSISALRGISPSSLRLSIDDFELLDDSELTIVRDGDLICIGILPEDAIAHDRSTQALGQSSSRAAQKHSEVVASLKRKRHASTSSSSSPESDTESSTTTSESESDSKTSSSESTSDSEGSSRPTTSSLQKTEARKVLAKKRPQVTSVQPKQREATTLVPPGYGKPQTRARNLRRRLKRVHEREGVTTERGPVSGANAATPVEKAITPDTNEEGPQLMSLSLRNKNKAKNFKSFIGRPLPPKIIFGDEGDVSIPGATITPVSVGSKPQTPVPRLIPPSSRPSLPPNLFVTSIDVLRENQRKRKMHNEFTEEPTVTLDYGPAEPDVDVDKLESVANSQWDMLEKPTSERVTPGMIVGYKALGINPATYTPEMLLTVVRVVSYDGSAVVVSPLRVRGELSFSGPIDDVEAVAEAHTWVDIARGDWRIVAADSA